MNIIPCWSVCFLILVVAANGKAIVSSRVSFLSGSETVNARWVMPEGKGPFPAIVLVHEWWGLNEWMDRKADELAGEGFAVLEVDLYRGKSTADPEEAHELMRGLPADRVMRDLSAAVDYLKKQPSVNAKKIGVIGWCMGGGYALQLAGTCADLAACVVYYGSLPTEKAFLEKIACPVLALFGAEDRGIPLQAVEQFRETMEELGKKVTVRIYERAGHAFLNENRPSYYKPAAVDSWKRTLTFFSNTLQN